METQERSGAMTQAMRAFGARQRRIRVGVLQDRRIVREATLGDRLRIGPSERCDVSLVDACLPTPHTILERRGQKLLLRLREGMTARVRHGGRTDTLAGPVERLLEADARGRIDLQGASVLFSSEEFARPVRASLPPVLRTRGRTDWSFTFFVLLSYLGVFSFVVFLENADRPIDAVSIGADAYMARLIFDEPTPPPRPAPPVTRPETEAPTVAEAPERTTRRASETRHPQRTATRPTGPSEATIRDHALDQAESLIMGALAEAGESLFRDVLADGHSGEAGEILAGVAGVNIAARGQDVLRERGASTAGPADDLGVIHARQRGPAREGDALEERRPRARVRVGPIEDELGVGDLDPRVVTAAVRRRMRRVQRCYEHAIRTEGSVGGRVVVEFTVQERGNLTGIRVDENRTGSRRIGDCVADAFRAMRIRPGPSGGSVSFRYPLVFAPPN